jgi:hypothetical protein
MKKPRQVRATERRDSSKSRSDPWIDNEVMGCKFQDVRHSKRMRQLLEQLSGKIGATTPWASQVSLKPQKCSTLGTQGSQNHRTASLKDDQILK